MTKKQSLTYSNICSKRALVDYRIESESIDELTRLGVKVYKTTPINSLYTEVDGHADMQIHFIDKKAVCAPEAYDYYKSLDLPDIKLICGSRALYNKYPDDIAYNVCSFGKYVICRPLCTAIEILTEYHYLKKEILNTRQGYAKCNICIVSDNCVITSDNGLYKLMTQHGIETLKIRKGFIDLYNMEGFIGGASGLIDNKTLCFNGNIKTHPDAENIKSFCKNAGVDVISLNNGNLKDIGSILVF